MTSILIVDDSPVDLEAARSALATEGFEIAVARSSDEALAEIRTHPPRLLLMEASITGPELTRKLRESPETRDLVIVAMSVDARDCKQMQYAGCDDCIVKPIDSDAVALLRQRLVSARRTPKPPRGRTQSVLLVEPSPHTRELVRQTLAEEFEVLEAADGGEALAIASARRPDLVVQDLALPDLSGIELAARLRALHPSAPPPNICICGFVSRLGEVEAAEAGFSVVVLKPIDPLYLLDVVRCHVATEEAAVPEGGTRRHILIVDDNRQQLKLAQAWFSMSGFDVTVASDGPSAIELSRRGDFAAIVSDVLMPGLDGFELASAVRANPITATVPVVLTSSEYLEASDHALARRMGATALVPKGDGIEQLARAVLAAIEKPTATPTRSPTIDALASEHLRRVNAQLERQVEYRNALSRRCALQSAQLAVIAGVADAVAQNRPLDDVLDAVLSACIDLTGLTRSAAFLPRTSGGFHLSRQLGFSPTELAQIDAQLALPSVRQELQQSGTVLLPVDVGGTAFLVLAMKDRVRLFGVIVLGGKRTELAEGDIFDFAHLLGSQLGQAMRLADVFGRLALSEQRFRSLVGSMEDIVLELDENAKVNAAHGLTLGRIDGGAAALVGRSLAEIFDHDDTGPNAETLAQIARGESTPFETILAAEDENLHVQVAVSPVRDDQGTLTGSVAVVRDVTEAVRFERLKEEFLRVAAHELKTPVAIIKATAQLGLRAIAGEPALRRSLDSLNRGADRIDRIVTDLLDISQIRLGRFTLHPEIIDLSELVEEVSKPLVEASTRHALDLEADASAPVRVDRERLKQVVRALVGNAVKFSPGGGKVHVSIKTTDTHAVVSVRDHGIGLAKSQQGHVFECFYHPHGNSPHDYGGMGVGLHLARQVVERHGGHIAFMSEENVGTTCSFDLPLITRNGADKACPS